MSQHAIALFRAEGPLLFRDARCFDASDNARTTLPSIESIYGAIRTAYLRKHKIDLRDSTQIQKHYSVIGDAEDPGQLKLVGPFLFLHEEGKRRYFFPTPRHLTLWKDDQNEWSRCGFLKPHQKDTFSFNGCSLHTLWDGSIRQGESLASEYPWIDLDGLMNLKLGNPIEKKHFQKTDAFFRFESRLGIGLREDQKNADEKMIFRIRSLRFRDNAGFFVFVSHGQEVLDGITTLFLGGKQGIVTVAHDILETGLFAPIEDSEKLLMLITPAIFEKGFLPNLDNGKLSGISLEAVCCGKPVPVGGWDMRIQKPKPLMHAMAPGSVFFVRGTPKKKELTEFRKAFGFGNYIELKRGWRETHG